MTALAAVAGLTQRLKPPYTPLFAGLEAPRFHDASAVTLRCCFYIFKLSS